ncbi:hypothetical protein V1503_07850 [Bacillus sp. SCS-151]|uniref:hypothetical protein n=1 Tax=Nanhaiella sioensis TaxID=3115293 RepID=UPI00397E3F0D
MIKYTDFFELLNTEKEDPVAALFMTYGFDAELFEYFVLPNFLGIIGNSDDRKEKARFRHQIALKLKDIPVTVFSDGKQYHGGRTFLYDHITISTQTFHPKSYLLLYKTFLRVIIASCNISKGGLCFNAETVWYEDIKLDKPSSISKNLLKILIWIADHYGTQGNDAIKEIIRFLKETTVSGEEFPKLVSTVNKNCVFRTLFSVIQEVNEECESISILSPFYENDRDRAVEKSLLIEFSDEFKTAFPKAKMKIYFPAVKSQEEGLYKVTAPVNIFEEVYTKYKDIELNVIHREWLREDDEPVLRVLHAKIIMFELKSGKKLILSGSINFTNNAMRSKIGALKNIEIGVLEYGKSNFEFPNSTLVQVKDLSYEDKKVSEKSMVIFVERAVLDEKKLMIILLKEQQTVPFKIEYQNHAIYEWNGKEDTISIEAFHLKQSQDLHIICADYDFYVPIEVMRKDEIVTDDLKLSFELNIKDIIDFLAGKYKSISEIKRLKRVQGINTIEGVGELTVYFKYNLQRYYKAMASLKQGLELPYYTEMAFKNYLANPIGLKNLIYLIVEDFKEGRSRNEETFLFLVEIENVINHLQFPEDRLDKDFKKLELQKMMIEPIIIRKRIYKKSKKTIREQFDVMLKAYGLGV